MKGFFFGVVGGSLETKCAGTESQSPEENGIVNRGINWGESGLSVMFKDVRKNCVPMVLGIPGRRRKREKMLSKRSLRRKEKGGRAGTLTSAGIRGGGRGGRETYGQRTAKSPIFQRNGERSTLDRILTTTSQRGHRTTLRRSLTERRGDPT